MTRYDGREAPFLNIEDFQRGAEHLAEMLERMSFRVPLYRYWVMGSAMYHTYSRWNTVAYEAFSLLSQSEREILVHQYPVQAILLLGQDEARKLWSKKRSFSAAARAATMVRHMADACDARLAIRGVAMEVSVIAFNRLVAESASKEAPEGALLFKHGFDWKVEGEECGEASGGSGSNDGYEYCVTWYRDTVQWMYVSRSGSSSVIFKKEANGHWRFKGEVTDACLSTLEAAGLSVEVCFRDLAPVPAQLYLSAF